MEANRSVNESARRKIRRLSVGTRYPEDRILELDLVRARLGMKDRAKVVEAALDEYLERKRSAGVI